MVKVAILGLGARGGYIYSAFAEKRPDLMKIVAIADKKVELVEKYKTKFNISQENCFTSAEEFLAKEKMSDVVIIATQDRAHYNQTMLALDRGYHILLEKPISPSLTECIAIEKKSKEKRLLVAVCHVLRYTKFFRFLKDIIDSGEIGKVRGIEQTENVAYWHYAHSFIRGNWRNSDETSPMILQKCCHDLDIIQWLLGKKPIKVSSFGSLEYFKKENAPAGSTYRCIENCKVKETCPYSAERFYLEAYDKMSEYERKNNWIFNVLCSNSVTKEKIEKAMKESNYGVCVFKCDNNVVDHEVVSILFEDNLTATLTMSAFTKDCFRQIKVFGTNGEIEANDFGNIVKVKPFLGEEKVYDIATMTDDLSGHGGGDNKLLEEFLTLVDSGDYSNNVSSSIEKSVLSHIMAFAAENSRLNAGKVIDINEYKLNNGEGND